MNAVALPGFEYAVSELTELTPIVEKDEKTNKTRLVALEHAKLGRLRPSDRFTTSLAARFGFAPSIYRYFEHAEVFSRIRERSKSAWVRLCVEVSANGNKQLLGVSSPDKTVIRASELLETISTHRGDSLAYTNGLLSARQTPRSGEVPFTVAGDEFMNRLHLECPIDGYGRPSFYLMLVRRVCINGCVGYASAFRSEIAGGDNIRETLDRAMESFDSPDGFDALRRRFDAAAISKASVNEAQRLYKMLIGLHHTGDVKSGEGESNVIRCFHKLTKDMNAKYGVMDLDALSIKRQQAMDIDCRVLDLLTFASEIATHRSSAAGALKMQSYCGQMLTEEYDLERSAADAASPSIDRFITGTDEAVDTEAGWAAFSNN